MDKLGTSKGAAVVAEAHARTKAPKRQLDVISSGPVIQVLLHVQHPATWQTSSNPTDGPATTLPTCWSLYKGMQSHSVLPKPAQLYACSSRAKYPMKPFLTGRKLRACPWLFRAAVTGPKL